MKIAFGIAAIGFAFGAFLYVLALIRERILDTYDDIDWEP